MRFLAKRRREAPIAVRRNGTFVDPEDGVPIGNEDF
jgi:hypothetical protein